MGTDIWLYKEKKVDNEWVSADSWEPSEYDGRLQLKNRNYDGRNYNLFGFLARVRCDHSFSFQPRGIPLNMSLELEEYYKEWGDHTPSYLYLHELKDAWNFIKDKTIKISGMKKTEEIKKLKESIESDQETDWSLLYPYCGWTNAEGHEDFSVDQPAQIALSGLKQIIDSFVGIDGDNHRIVFWFDS